MPSIITHDFFGQDVYNQLRDVIGFGEDERAAYLLGNQGPDPLFYLVLDPRAEYRNAEPISHTMHLHRTAELIHALKQSISILDPEDKSIGRAYALGFLSHYCLDSVMHPFIYYYQFAICDAGEPDINRGDGREVHSVIETELDEMMLYTRLGKTIASFNPSKEILQASDRVLSIISTMYGYVIMVAYGKTLPKQTFKTAVKLARLAQHGFHSSTGTKRFIFTTIEKQFRRYSFINAMSPRAIELEESQFENREHATWTNPHTEETSTESFNDLYERALKTAPQLIEQFLDEHFDLEAAHALTGDLNFEGRPRRFADAQ